MKAVVIEKFGDLDDVKVEEAPVPYPQKDEVQIEVHYSGINPVDWKICEGVLKDFLPHEFPIILGWDVSGTISEIGSEVKGWNIGDKVFAYCRKPVIKWGTFTEYICLESKNIAKMPNTISFAEASAIPLAGLTAWQSLFDFANLKSGQTVLIHAGAGGVGGFAIQFAKHAKAKVYTTASESHHEYVKSLGADEIIDYRKENFVESIKRFEPEGVDVVYDCVGGKTLRESFQCVKKEGCVVSIVNFNVETLGKEYGVRSGFVLVSPSGKQLEEIGKLIEEGKVKPPSIEEHRLEDAKQALLKSKEGHTEGKIVLKVR